MTKDPSPSSQTEYFPSQRDPHHSKVSLTFPQQLLRNSPALSSNKMQQNPLILTVNHCPFNEWKVSSILHHLGRFDNTYLVVCPVQAAMPSAAVNTCESVYTFEDRQTVVWLVVPRVYLCVVMTHTVKSTPWWSLTLGQLSFKPRSVSALFWVGR